MEEVWNNLGIFVFDIKPEWFSTQLRIYGSVLVLQSTAGRSHYDLVPMSFAKGIGNPRADTFGSKYYERKSFELLLLFLWRHPVRTSRPNAFNIMMRLIYLNITLPQNTSFK
jgi:hypothetical protein